MLTYIHKYIDPKDWRLWSHLAINSVNRLVSYAVVYIEVVVVEVVDAFCKLNVTN